MKLLFTIIAAMFVSIAAMAQNDTKHLAGIVLDKTTYSPLSGATLTINSHPTYTTDNAGRVGASVAVGDTLTFRHIGYRNAQIIAHDSLFAQSIFAIFLSSDTVQIAEVIVRPRIYRLAETARYMPVAINSQEIIAQQNFRRSTHTALTAPPTAAWDVHQNQSSVINRSIHEIEYRHMVSPDRMVSVGTTAIAAIAQLILKSVADDKSSVRPVTVDEIENLIRIYAPTDTMYLSGERLP